MRQAWTIAMMQMRLVTKGRAVLLVFLALPLLFTALIGGILSSASGGSSTSGAPAGRVYPVAIVDRDQSFVSLRLAAEMAANPTLKIIPAAEGDLTKLFADHRLDSAVIIPAGFQEAIISGAEPTVDLVVPPGGNTQVGVGPVVRRYAVRIVQDYLLARTAAGRSADAPTGATSEAAVLAAYDRIVADRQAASVGVDFQSASRPQTKDVPGGVTIGEYALGFSTTFVMMMVFMMAGFILQERQQGTWARLLTAPASRTAVLGGYLIAFFLTGMFQFAALIAFTSLLFHVSWGPLLPLTAVAAAFVLTSTGAGLFLAGIVKTPEQQNAIGVLFITATSMLGGVYWPLDMVGDTMRRIGYLTPQAWAMDGFREVVLRGAAWSNLAWPLVVLLGFAAIFLTAGVLRIRYE